MSLAFNKFDNVPLALDAAKYNFATDSLLVALCPAANTPVRTNKALTDITQISYTNLSSRALTVSSSAQVSGLYTLKLNNITLTASGGAVAAFQYIVIYDVTATSNELICWFDYGSALTLNNGDSITLTFDAANGLFTIQ